MPACGWDFCIVLHRAIGGTIDVPTLGHVAFTAVSLDVAGKWGSGSLALMAQVDASLSCVALPCFVRGDLNNDPASCAELSFHQWVAPPDGTCRSAAGA